MSGLLTEKEVINIARIKLPLVVEAFTKANLEAQSKNARSGRIRELLHADEIEGYYDVSDLLDALHKLARKS